MKYKFAFLSLALFLLQPALALSSQPKACPSVESIKAVGLSVVMGSGTSWMVINHKNHYNTPEEWSFTLFYYGKDKDDALMKANESLTLLSLIEGPILSPDTQDKWYCSYGGMDKQGKKFFGIAFTPPFDQTQTISKPEEKI